MLNAGCASFISLTPTLCFSFQMFSLKIPSLENVIFFLIFEKRGVYFQPLFRCLVGLEMFINISALTNYTPIVLRHFVAYMYTP